jgi:DNA replication and repair protein RecF
MVQEGQREARIAGRFGSEKGGSIRVDFGKRQSASLDATNAKGVIWTIGEGGARAQVRVVGENAQKLIESGPEIRRLFMDWNLFHVEQSYGPALKRFRRIQQQRNAWLKAGGAGCPVWDEPYVGCSREITTKRFLYVDLLQRRLSDAYSELNGRIAPVSIRLDRGWPPHADLSHLLRSHYRKDVDRGFTYYGPSRADLLIRGIEAGGLASRGQLKLAVCLLQIAAERVARACGLPRSIWLLDDFPSELDASNQRALLDLFSASKSQIFGTTTQFEEGRLNELGETARVFHVERGQLIAS